MIVPILRTQNEILSQLESITLDTSNERWTDARIYEAVNLSVMDWEGRVRIPYVYTISGGWVAGTYEYTLPIYIDAGSIQPQGRYFRYDPVLASLDLDDETWTDIAGFDVEPNSSGGQTLRIHYGANDDGRVLWWGSNGPVPTTVTTLSADITSSATSLTIATKPTIGRVGYVKIDSEWIQYAGYTESASTLTLTNLVRGVAGTTAATHSAGASVYWGVAMDRGALWGQLLDQARAHLMSFWLSNPSSREVAHYEKQMVFYQQRADAFWKRYVPSRAPRLRLSKMGIGQFDRGWIVE